MTTTAEIIDPPITRPAGRSVRIRVTGRVEARSVAWLREALHETYSPPGPG